MHKLLIADDEAIIRKGLKSVLDWGSLDIEVVGEAEDGEIALTLIEKLRPDIVLLDICMPFLNGLELVKKIKDIDENFIIIIITGFDEFEYMHEALKLKVFDYLLKPINKKNLMDIILKALQELTKDKEKKSYITWANRQLTENIDSIRENFFNNLVNANSNETNIKKEMNFLRINLSSNIGIVIIKVIEKLNSEVISKKWDITLLSFAIKNMVYELLQNLQPVFAFTDTENNVVAIVNLSNKNEWVKVGTLIEEKVFKYLHYTVVTEQRSITDGVIKIKRVYDYMIKEINKKTEFKPVVLLAIKFINNNYYKNELSLEMVAKNFCLSSSYLSKLIKTGTGLSFIDYVTSIRIKKAISIMDDPTVKIYEVAELVGYSNQHYFCKAFKKVTGLSPTEYRSG
ncbi:response regulator transcription factor [Clostridium hydrogenum]|uniref:response regulator transcription factor n=1 Tax=Clostridium hydrogenum TaxID=2855764 RepID=UPI001F2B6A65|nr:response regulator [Clostridium hydrogenum]